MPNIEWIHTDLAVCFNVHKSAHADCFRWQTVVPAEGRDVVAATRGAFRTPGRRPALPVSR